MPELLHRLVVPSRLALIYRAGETLGYNPALNTWARLEAPYAETLRWLRAGRDRSLLGRHLARRFGWPLETDRVRLSEIVNWCVLRRLVYLDREPAVGEIVHPAEPLQTVYWICTQACNLRCTYCYQNATVARTHELSTAEGKDLVDQAVEAKVKTFIFTGGEPFSRRDLLEIAAYSKSRGLRTNVITNGHYITKTNLPQIVEIFDAVSISLDHMIPEHHERHRGTGSWQRAIDAIDLLLEAGVTVDVNSVLSHLGLTRAEDLLRLSHTRRIGAHRIVPKFPMGRAGPNREDEVVPDELIELSDLMHAAGQGAGGAQSSFDPESYSSKGIRRNHCGAGLSEVSVDPEGWVYPCKLLQYPQFRTENVREARIADIFRNNLGAVKNRVVDSLRPCRTCIIKNHCGGGCRGIHFSFTEDYLTSHPLFCAYLRNSFEVQAWSTTGAVPARREHSYRDAPVFQGNVVPVSELLQKS